MATILERERKFKAPATFDLARADFDPEPYAIAPAHRIRLHTIYYDTSDLRLTRWGTSLRFRVGDGWTVKLPAAGLPAMTARTEYRFAGDAGRIPDAARDLVRGTVRDAHLEPVVELRTIRTCRPVSLHDDDVGEIVADDVRVVHSHSVLARFRQIEIELRPAAPDAALERLSRAVRRAGAGRPDPQPKITIALGRAAKMPELCAPPVDAAAPASAVLWATLASCVGKFVATDPHLRSELSPDAIHEARVCVRKLRSALKTFAPLLDEAWATALRERLSWLNGILSVARDADVVLADVTQRAMDLPPDDRRHIDELLRPLREQRNSACTALGNAIRTQQYIHLIDDLIAAANAPRFSERKPMRSADRASRLIRPAWRRLRKAVRSAQDPSHDRTLHSIRIKAKHIRYAAEALAPLNSGVLRRLAKRAEQLQSILGEQHDAVIAIGVLRDLQQTPQRAFLSDAISTAEEENARDGRRRWRKAWKRLRRAYRALAS